MVEPHHENSLQMHYHRAEHWVVVSGTAEIQIEGEKRLYAWTKEGDSPEKHRMEYKARKLTETPGQKSRQYPPGIH